MVHFPAERAKMLLHVSEYNTPPRDESAAKPSVSSPILDDTGQVEEDHIIAHTLSMQLAYLDRQMLQDGVSMEEMEDLQFRREAMQSELNRVAAHSVPQPSTPTTIKTVSSDSEQSEHACFANIRKMLTQGANGPSSVGTHPLHTTPVASAVAGPSSGPLDTMTMDAHLMHVVEEMDSRTVFLLHLMKVGDAPEAASMLPQTPHRQNTTRREGSWAGGMLVSHLLLVTDLYRRSRPFCASACPSWTQSSGTSPPRRGAMQAGWTSSPRAPNHKPRASPAMTHWWCLLPKTINGVQTTAAAWVGVAQWGCASGAADKQSPPTPPNTRRG
jgi:hypothetical protein